MALKTTHAAALCAAILAGGCSFAEEALFPTAGNGSTAQAPASTTGTPPSLNSSTFEAPGVTSGAPTGTYVGQKVSGLRGDLQQLQATLNRHNQSLQAIRNDTVQDSQRYHGTVAAINARLQVGTTPGNPILTQQWNGAQGELDRISDDVLKMNRLSNEVTASSTMSAFLVDSVRSSRLLSGAVDDDHRQLRILEDETNRTVVLIERLLSELSEDITRQQSYISNERQNLNTLAVAIKNGQLYGGSLAYRIAQPASYDQMGMGARPAVGGDQPLVTIRFDRPNVNYESALYTAVKGALDRRPNATFDVVAVSPAGGTPGSNSLGAAASRRNAESVVRSLSNMGLPAARINATQSTGAVSPGGEVQVFVR